MQDISLLLRKVYPKATELLSDYATERYKLENSRNYEVKGH